MLKKYTWNYILVNFVQCTIHNNNGLNSILQLLHFQ